jgi:hypothetical protein
MRKFITENGQWESMSPALQFALNSAPHATKRYSPFLNPIWSTSEPSSYVAHSDTILFRGGISTKIGVHE